MEGEKIDMKKPIKFRIRMVEHLIKDYEENLEFYKEITCIESVVEIMEIIEELKQWKKELKMQKKLRKK